MYARIVQGRPRLQLPERATAAADVVGSAQRILDAAVATVRHAWDTMRLSRAFEVERTGADPRGRPRDRDIDLLRAAVVFAAAGLDATLKELIRTALPALAQRSAQSAQEFEKFVGDEISAPKVLAQVVVRPDADLRAGLLERYVEALTGDSLQSVGQVIRVCKALGIHENVRDRVRPGSTLERMFQERNKIIHEFDLTPEGRWQRQTRSIRETEDLVSEALGVAQNIINSVAQLVAAAQLS
jgi:hypothetical protein